MDLLNTVAGIFLDSAGITAFIILAGAGVIWLGAIILEAMAKGVRS